MKRPPAERGRAYIEALGGAANLAAVGACTTRLRLVVKDQGGVDEAALKALGARGLVRPSEKDLQVVVGATADQIAREINEALAAGPEAQPGASPDALVKALSKALGGAVKSVETRSSRLVVTLASGRAVDEAAVLAAGARAIAVTSPGKLDIVLGPEAGAAGALLAKLAPA
jgi:PTS system N-acetylglucosamine-specific IIC component